ncbi:M20 family metallo-hydrolase [Mesobacillus harenae]|uniref:M20 family metallo-hydrolase n=1 Tax=Mesobacillus harenae TaxID=2213203 RepID=UPI001580625F|nr:M20 family metallo-hydrolase [Mesobacillus harenae]
MEQFPDNLKEAIEWLASFGAVPEGGVTRTLYSKAWQDAQQALKEWMESVGLQTSYDTIGNLFGRLAADDPFAPTILVGSHVDTVKSGGKYDGAYGILAAIFAIEKLSQKYGKPAVNLEAVSLCEEEGSRFPIACWGSGMMTKIYSMQDIQSLQDSAGIRFGEAMKGAGFEPDHPYPIRRDIQTFIELHIEQGPTLENYQKSIGIVQAIVGQKRFHVTVTGESNHAGTTLMKWRKDPIHGVSTMITKLFEFTKEYDEDLVATVGEIHAKPNVSNVIPGEIIFTVDARHPSESVLHAFCECFSREFIEIAKDKGLEISIQKWHEVKPVQMNGMLNRLVQKICTANELAFHKMNSGAGHDAQFFAKVYPTTLLFVPSRAGISHSPLEFTEETDLENGLNVLVDLLYQLAY